MLRSRIITAAILAPCAIATVYLLSLQWYAVVFWLVGGLGAYEYSGLAGLTRRASRWSYVGVYTLLVIVTWWQQMLLPGVLWLGVVLWCLASLSVLLYPASAAIFRHGWLTGVIGIVICWAAWAALVVIRAAPDGSNWVLWLMLLVWGADIGAYFVGRRFGRNKLARAVSPGKTWEGFCGGLVTSSIVCGTMLLMMGRFNTGWLLIMVLLVGVSVFGDLFESVLKRVRGMKDSGSLLPGHGGVLDRIDSIVATSPCLALTLLLAGLTGNGVTVG